ncbi:hypothetical protein COU37_05170 [Candidatus Micrarchaeota archaeon CG10_big_fil_rev_8_21_14_0_10_45_29]|nr:MAG: hypothetical protein COU37_05170 [Candidatus Micrarchaeota archaeon CG10_big_fil_rev_8_21_14_0_10_45_29]
MGKILRSTVALEESIVSSVWEEIPFRVKVRGLPSAIRYALLFLLKAKNPKKFNQIKHELKSEDHTAILIEEVDAEL